MRTLLILAAMSLTGCMQTIEPTGPSTNEAKPQTDKVVLSSSDSAAISITTYLNGRHIVDSYECEEWNDYAIRSVANHWMTVQEAISVIPSNCFTK